jgi:hypothetical protein
MRVLTSALLTDGSSDRALIPLIVRSLQNIAPKFHFADIAVAEKIPGALRDRVVRCLNDYPCDLLFVHRDAENQGLEARLHEIETATAQLAVKPVAVVPVKMTESWLITDESSIRRAVGNPSGNEDLGLPEINRAERVDAKKVLDSALSTAAFKSARRRKKFRPESYRFRVAEELPSLENLQRLGSYIAFEDRLRMALDSLTKNGD